MSLASILKNAMSLAARERAVLAEKLLASLDELSEEEADRLWAAEAQRRVKEYYSGRAKSRPAARTHRKAEALFR